MTSPGMAAIHGRVARLHAELTQRSLSLVDAASGGATLRVALAVEPGTGASLRRCSLTS